MSYGLPHTDFYPYSSWGCYGSWSQPPSYSAPHQFANAELRKSAFERKPHCKDRFDQANRSRVQEKKMVVKQVYRVKRDGRKDKSSDLSTNNEKS